MKAAVAIKTQTYLSCPECGADAHSWGERAVGSSFGPWYCDDCGFGIKGVATEDGADIEEAGGRKLNTLVLLRLYEPLKNGNSVHIVVEGMTFVKPGQDPDFSNDEYFYNEHTCPWNYLRLPLKDGEDCDPHGVFVHQETILMPDGYDSSIDGLDEWKMLFSSLRDETEIIH